MIWVGVLRLPIILLVMSGSSLLGYSTSEDEDENLLPTMTLITCGLVM